MKRESGVRFFQEVWETVRRIPRGRVATYGQIARLLGKPGGARTVGWAMRALPDGSDIPWHRVINSAGRISLQNRARELQRRLLESEGVLFESSGRVDLSTHGWNP